MSFFVTHPTMAIRWSLANWLFGAAFWIAPDGPAKELIRKHFNVATETIMREAGQ